MNKKAFELAISTIILLVIGVAVLIAIILAVTGGFNRFKTTINPLLETAEGSAIRQSCQLACQENNRFNFCCTSREINNEEIKCSDSRLEINCNFNCDNFQCNNPLPTNNALQTCSRLPNNIIECPSGYICNEQLSGGLSPTEGRLPIESIGGDKKCHKECLTDNDCPSETPNCLTIGRLTEDYSERFKLCF